MHHWGYIGLSLHLTGICFLLTPSELILQNRLDIQEIGLLTHRPFMLGLEIWTCMRENRDLFFTRNWRWGKSSARFVIGVLNLSGLSEIWEWIFTFIALLEPSKSAYTERDHGYTTLIYSWRNSYKFLLTKLAQILDSHNFEGIKWRLHPRKQAKMHSKREYEPWCHEIAWFGHAGWEADRQRIPSCLVDTVSLV